MLRSAARADIRGHADPLAVHDEAVQRAPERLGTARDVLQKREPVGRPALAAAALMTIAYAILSLGRDDFWTMALGIVILDALRVRARAGAAVVVVSHRPDAAAGATAVYRLSEGRLEL